ncbi:DUF7673 family protein [Variovorax sp. HJSM1_2]|uniref:DUF7673 family protein n=1 Tax=Variovorax sp. HJSM1_2 TaxID=3366263 RepID=UPI003BD51579
MNMQTTQAERMAQHRATTIARYTPEQQTAILRLYNVVQQHPGTSGSRYAAKFLLGLYNGRRFPFDLTDLRAVDTAIFEAAMVVLRMDARHTWCEVHVLLDALLGEGANTGAELEHWAYDMRLKGACKKAELPEVVGA